MSLKLFLNCTVLFREVFLSCTAINGIREMFSHRHHVYSKQQAKEPISVPAELD